ncbi:uncharacterized protein LOC135692299 [Rhopilema esculentum]|uniref:uncharacterized protein LOC135692299 n=1 Tax=Rhopilema esculentum TaxID=499914 RepID=UPI0031E343E5|eukprot:gene3321-1656_t
MTLTAFADWKLYCMMMLALPLSTLSFSCTSRFHCKTPEVKYISMDKLTNMTLNGTVLKSFQAKDISECQRSCLHEEKCQSLNVNISTAIGLTCDLLDINIYSNSSLLLQQSGSVHLFIPNECKNKPCKNNAVCVPNYQNDSYSCECKSNGTWITKGLHCETILNGYSSAFVYWSFDDPASLAPLTSTNLDMSSYVASSWTPVSEPGRRHPVVKCNVPGHAPPCMYIKSNVPCLHIFGTCELTVTYSVWIKYTEFEASRSAPAYVFHSYAFNQRRGVHFSSKSDGKFTFAVSISLSKRWIIEDFGGAVVKTNWNQFTFTVDDNAGSCAFVNGVKDACQSTHASVSLSDLQSSFKIGDSPSADIEPGIYVDDLAVWQVILTEDEVKNLYEQTKE